MRSQRGSRALLGPAVLTVAVALACGGTTTSSERGGPDGGHTGPQATDCGASSATEPRCNEPWSVTVATGERAIPFALIVDARGDVLVTGRASATGDGTASQAFVVKLSGATGETLWDARVSESNHATFDAVAVDLAGDVVAGGGVLDGTGSVAQPLLARLRGTDGTVGPTTVPVGLPPVQHLALDGDGNVALVGTSQVASMTPDLALRWAHDMSGRAVAVTSLWMTRAGDPVVLGAALGASPAGFATTFAMSVSGAAGEELWSWTHDASPRVVMLAGELDEQARLTGVGAWDEDGTRHHALINLSTTTRVLQVGVRVNVGSDATEILAAVATRATDLWVLGVERREGSEGPGPGHLLRYRQDKGEQTAHQVLPGGATTELAADHAGNAVVAGEAPSGGMTITKVVVESDG